jgi:hypothetical protein
LHIHGISPWSWDFAKFLVHQISFHLYDNQDPHVRSIKNKILLPPCSRPGGQAGGHASRRANRRRGRTGARLGRQTASSGERGRGWGRGRGCGSGEQGHRRGRASSRPGAQAADAGTRASGLVAGRTSRRCGGRERRLAVGLASRKAAPPLASSRPRGRCGCGLAGGQAPSVSIWEAAPPLVWSSGGGVKRASGLWWATAGSRARGRGGGSEQTKERTVFSH